MDEHGHDHEASDMISASPRDTGNTHSDPTPVTRADLAALRAELKTEFASIRELQCPSCAPAAIVRMHPELGPQPVGPASLRTNTPEPASEGEPA